MKNRRRVSTVLAAFVAVAGFCLSPSCSGGNDTVSAGLTATFAPYTPTPSSLSVTLQPGAASGDTFSVRVAVKDVSNFFGAAFHVSYNPASAAFVSMDATGSFLQGAGIQADSFKALVATPGDLAVVATRFQNGTGTIPGVYGNGDLLVLTFRATASTSGNSLNFASPKEVCADTSTGCTAVTVLWSGGLLTAN